MPCDSVASTVVHVILFISMYAESLVLFIFFICAQISGIKMRNQPQCLVFSQTTLSIRIFEAKSITSDNSPDFLTLTRFAKWS